MCIMRAFIPVCGKELERLEHRHLGGAPADQQYLRLVLGAPWNEGAIISSGIAFSFFARLFIMATRMSGSSEVKPVSSCS